MKPVEVKWVDGMQFMGVGGSGHAVVLDAASQDEGSDTGSRPTEMLLMALGGCSGIDVIQILTKGRVKVDRFQIRLRGDRAEDHPRKFLKIEMEYLFWGKAIPPDRVERAIALSRDKYCSVGATLAGSVEMTTRYKINPPE